MPNRTTHTKRGEDHPQAKLTEDIVITLLRLHKSGIKLHILAKDFQIPYPTVVKIINRMIWKHVKFEDDQEKEQETVNYGLFK